MIVQSMGILLLTDLLAVARSLGWVTVGFAAQQENMPGHPLMILQYATYPSDSKSAEATSPRASSTSPLSSTGLATSGEIPVACLVSHCLPAERFIEGVALTRDRESGAIKVGLACVVKLTALRSFQR